MKQYEKPTAVCFNTVTDVLLTSTPLLLQNDGETQITALQSFIWDD